MDDATFRLCNGAHRALTADLCRRLRGYHSNVCHMDTLALAMLDLDGAPLDIHGNHAESVPNHLHPLCDQRADVREWAKREPPPVRSVWMVLT